VNASGFPEEKHPETVSQSGPIWQMAGYWPARASTIIAGFYGRRFIRPWRTFPMYEDRPLQEFLDGLASKSPTPGGGSAAAIIGAMGAALVSMVCNLTVGKAGYSTVEEDMKSMLNEAEALRTRLTDMVRADVEAFDRVMAAYRLPKENDEQKQVRSAAIQEALKAPRWSGSAAQPLKKATTTPSATPASRS
jgi:hypothetical protein